APAARNCVASADLANSNPGRHGCTQRIHPSPAGRRSWASPTWLSPTRSPTKRGLCDVQATDQPNRGTARRGMISGLFPEQAASRARRSSEQPGELGLLSGVQDILDSDEKRDLRLLDLFLEAQDPVHLLQNLRLIDRFPLKQPRHLLHLSLQVELGFHELRLGLEHFAANRGLLRVVETDFLTVRENLIRRKQISCKRVFRRCGRRTLS